MMSTKTKNSDKLQTKMCISSGCNQQSEVICKHCEERYCHLCFMCHRKHFYMDIDSMFKKISSNRDESVSQVTEFIDEQAKDAHSQVQKLIDDTIDRIVQTSQNIYTYIENRRLAKHSRLEECLDKFDKDSELLSSKLSTRTLLSADKILELRRTYAYNMFDSSSTITIKSECDEIQRKNERFFENYRYFNELLMLRQKWTFLQPALTTVYFPAKKDISLDKILTFLEYRQDRVLENYRQYLSTNENCKDQSLKSLEELLNELSFVSKRVPRKLDDCTYINDESSEQVHELHTASNSVKNYMNNREDDKSSNSSVSWQVLDEDDHENQFYGFDESIETLAQRFENGFQPFRTNIILEDS